MGVLQVASVLGMLTDLTKQRELLSLGRKQKLEIVEND